LLFSGVSLSILWNLSTSESWISFFWLGLSVDPNRLLFSSLSGQVLIAQDLYTPASLLVRRIRMDLWHFCQGHHSHYTTLHSRVQTKDSRRIKRLRPPALSLLTILSHRLADFVRLHITEA
jgi:5-carboxymethyl-2-hydroxymuconate isomerase